MAAITETPFPWPPMIAIAIGLVSHSYALTSLFPYVGYMVQHLGVTDDKDEAGYYAGYIASAFMVGRVASSYFWGRFADQYGRLPVVYIGLGSMAVLSIAFGLSPTFAWAVGCRFLLGVTNGLLGICKTMISEICGKEHETVGMSSILGCSSIGLVIGPGLGGLLSEPAKHYPTVFSESGLFGRYPYLLPNVVGASIALLGFPLVFFFVKETKHLHNSGGASTADFKPIPTQEPGGAGTDDSDDTGVTQDMQGEDHRLLSSRRGNNERLDLAGEAGHIHGRVRGLRGSRKVEGFGMDGLGTEGGQVARRRRRRPNACWQEFLVPVRLLQDKRICTIIFVYSIFSFVHIGCREVYPLWALSTVQAGGVDWTTKEIGQALSVCGIGMLVFQVMVYPCLSKRIGITRSQRSACLLSIPVFLAFPALSRLRDSERALFEASLALLFLTNIVSNVVFINISLAVNNAVDPSRRATLNGLSMTLGSVAKAAGPPFFSAIFAWSVDNHHRPFPLDYHLAFYLLALGMMVVSWASWDTVVSPCAPVASGARTEDEIEMGERRPRKSFPPTNSES